MTDQDDSSTLAAGSDRGPTRRLEVAMDRLPPPAFPPGDRRRPVHRPRSRTGDEEGSAGRFPEGAYFSPDGPIRRVPEGLESEPDGGSVSSDRVESPDGVRSTISTPSAREISTLLEALASEVRSLGSARFRWKPGAPPLEAALRGVLSGYLRPGSGNEGRD